MDPATLGKLWKESRDSAETDIEHSRKIISDLIKAPGLSYELRIRTYTLAAATSDTWHEANANLLEAESCWEAFDLLFRRPGGSYFEHEKSILELRESLDEYAAWHLQGELHLQKIISDDSTEDDGSVRPMLVEDEEEEVELTPDTNIMRPQTTSLNMVQPPVTSSTTGQASTFSPTPTSSSAASPSAMSATSSKVPQHFTALSHRQKPAH